MRINLSWLSNLRVFQKGLILVGVPLLISFVLVGVLYYLVLESDKERSEEQRHKKIAAATTRLMVYVYDAGFSLHTAVQQMDRQYFQRFKDDLANFSRAKKELTELSDQDPKTSADYHKLIESIKPKRDYLPLLAELAQHKLTPAKLVPLFASLRKDAKLSSFQMSDNLGQILREQEANIEASPQRQAAVRQKQFASLLAGMVLSIVACFLLARFFMTNIVERLKVISDNAKRLAQEQPLNPSLEGKDEIADLDAVFHRMAEALARAAQKERAAFDNASDVICVLDSEAKFTRINAACSRLWGRNSSDLTGHKVYELLADEDKESTKQAILLTQSGNPAAGFETRIIHADGHIIYTLWSVYWSDTESALFCVAHDISERKQAEQMKQEFLGMVSHDLRSPLTSIFGVFQLLAARAFGDLPEMAETKLGMAAKNVNRLLSLVNDLLDIEKLEAGQMELDREPTSVLELLKRSAQDVETLAEQKAITVAINCRAELFSLDIDRMMQVLVNLLSNAIKFSPVGGKVILSAVSTRDGLEISVQDQGRGVPAAHRQTIFERFKQVEASDGKRKSGTGLGLPICKQIVELHGGTIGVDSDEGKGSTFWMKIPLMVHEVETTRLQAMSKISPGKISKQAISSNPYETIDTTSQRSSLLSHFSLAGKGSVLVGVPVLLGLTFVLMLTVVLILSDRDTAAERHNYEIWINGNKLMKGLYECGTAMAISKSQESWKQFERAARQVKIAEQKLEDLTVSDSQELKEVVTQLNNTLSVADAFMSHALSFVHSRGETLPAITEAFEGHDVLEPIVADITQYIEKLGMLARAEEDRLRNKIARFRSILNQTLLSAIIFSTGTSVALALFFSRGVTSRLYILRDNSIRLAAYQPLNPPLKGNDEIAYLDEVFHSMAKTLRDARQKERAVFDNSLDVICALDKNAVFRQVNPACQRLWGYTMDEMLGQPLQKFLSDEDQSASIAALSVNQEGSRRLENRVLCKDGTSRDILWSVSWSPSDELFFCTAHDISKRKELERLKQEFLSMVSHDLRTPLTAILGVSKLGTAGAFGQLPEKAIKQLAVVTRNVERLLNLINDLLDIEKLESGQMQLTVENIPAWNILERSHQALDTFAEQKKVKLVAEPSDAQIAGDADRLIQVMVNLISNAIKFSPEGSTVTLSAVCCPDFVEFKVKDEGRGVPESFKETIFERFKQVESADGKRKSGTGLGLPICKQIVISHGGTIGVESEVGKGSTFWFKIPRAATK